MSRRNISKLLVLVRNNGVYQVFPPNKKVSPVQERLGGGRLEIDTANGEWHHYTISGVLWNKGKIGEGRNPNNYNDGVVGVYTRSSDHINRILAKAYESHIRDLPGAD